MELPTTKPALADGGLILRTATGQAEIDHIRQALNQGHYLKAGRPAGHVLWQGIYQTDGETGQPQLVAALCWGGAAKRLKERDNLVGWDSVTCANRLKLAVQLRRFFVVGSARRPNLACQWKEDASRPRKKASGGQVLSLLRGVVLRLYGKEAFATLNASFNYHSARAGAPCAS